jgi:2-polyprenyl-6-methoxyphenol hydroxylase-like FAD-dependent oxidoreductase
MKKYPVMRQLFGNGVQLDDHYGTGEPFMSRQHIRTHARNVAGDGWLLVGDAAFFVDPLISPGLTGGTAQAYIAATESVKALDENIYTKEFFTKYERFVRSLHEALERDNQMVYMSFNHPEAMKLIQRFQEIDARRHFVQNRGQEYTEADTKVWGILNPAYQELQKAAWEIMREEEMAVSKELSINEQSAHDYERMVERLKTVLEGYVTSHTDLTPYANTNQYARL